MMRTQIEWHCLTMACRWWWWGAPSGYRVELQRRWTFVPLLASASAAALNYKVLWPEHSCCPASSSVLNPLIPRHCTGGICLDWIPFSLQVHVASRPTEVVDTIDLVAPLSPPFLLLLSPELHSISLISELWGGVVATAPVLIYY